MTHVEHMSHQERQERACMMRTAGMTLQEIADVFGITRERVRQLTKNYVLAGESRESRQARETSRTWELIKEDYIGGMVYAELQSRYNVSPNYIAAAIHTYATPVEAAMHTHNGRHFKEFASKQKYSDEELLEILRQASPDGAPTSCTEYRAAREQSGNLPTYVLFVQRFGSWSKAQKAAGFNVKVSGPRSDRKWPLEKMLEVLIPLVEAYGTLPSVHRYIKLSKGGTLPSNVLVRNRFREELGIGEWSEIRLYLLTHNQN